MIPLPYVPVVLHAGLLILGGLAGYIMCDMAIRAALGDGEDDA